ncbi:MAG: GNAT family N-acetyltransferase [Rhodospirillales bacterium]
MTDLVFRPLSGKALDAVIPDIARLRITVFRDWPYLYDGTAEYEAWYLRTLMQAEGNILVVCLDGNQIVGAATGAPLASQHEEFREPFERAGENTADWFYCAESVLLPGWRGRGAGHRFFDEREHHARSLGFTRSTFCAVRRPDDHPMRPANYRPLDDFWKRRGYRPRPDRLTSFRWKDIGQPSETAKPMQFWTREDL